MRAGDAGRGSTFSRVPLTGSICPKDAGWTGLYAGTAAHALGISHRLALAGQTHYINALMTNRSAHRARYTFLFLSEYAKSTEACVNVHEGSHRTRNRHQTRPLYQK